MSPKLRVRVSPRDALMLVLGAVCAFLFTLVSSYSQDGSNFAAGQYRSFEPPSPVQRRRPLSAHDHKHDALHNSIVATRKNTEEKDVSSARKDLRPTRILAHAPGWTIFENLYMSNGTLLIVTTSEERAKMPDPIWMTSNGEPAVNTPENIKAREPKPEHMDYISPENANSRWSVQSGDILNVDGSTLLFNDPNQFIDHYYHFVAELWFGTWNFWTGTLAPDVKPNGDHKAPPIDRAIFAHCQTKEWRDKPGFNAHFLRASFPSLSIETQTDWDDRINMTSNGDKAFVFERVMLADRSAAFRGKECGATVSRTAAEPYVLTKDRISEYWWEPVRRSVLRFAGVEESVINIPSLYDGAKNNFDMTYNPPIVVTYISRQNSRNTIDGRKLAPDQHSALVARLTALCSEKRWELNVVSMEKLSKDAQLRLVARTTVMIGVHGNGLTHLLFMPETPRSTVIELFNPGGFAHDYEWLTRARGLKHYAVWNDTHFTYPTLPWVKYNEGFHSTHLIVSPETVVNIIIGRVEGKLLNHDHKYSEIIRHDG